MKPMVDEQKTFYPLEIIKRDLSTEHSEDL